GLEGIGEKFEGSQRLFDDLACYSLEGEEWPVTASVVACFLGGASLVVGSFLFLFAREVLVDFQENPKAAQEHTKNPGVMDKIQKLISAGIVQMK
ncbi:heat shock protein sti-like, partial [Trifolium pratense]